MQLPVIDERGRIPEAWKRPLFPPKPPRRALGTFSKGVPDRSASLNFARSANDNCDRGCSHWKKCYAARLERYRGSLMTSGERRARSCPVDLVERATREIERKPAISWLRFCAFGALPKLGKLSPSKRAALGRALTILHDTVTDRGGKCHVPAETARKARSYRKILPENACVRESVHTMDRWKRADGPVSIAMEAETSGRAASLAMAQKLARIRRTETGRACIVCPAVICSFKKVKAPGAHCGACTACAESHLDVVYPHH